MTYHFATYGTLQRFGRTQTRICPQDGKVSFRYPQIVHDHFYYRDVCDNHNGRRMFPIAIEEQLRTNRWIVRSFDFFIALTEVNLNHVRHDIFKEKLHHQVDFRFKLAEEMIDNAYLEEERAETRRSKRICVNKERHRLMTCPIYQKFKDGELVECTTRYYQKKCCKCNKKPRTYCSCSPGVFMCVGCFGEHIRESVFGD